MAEEIFDWTQGLSLKEEARGVVHVDGDVWADFLVCSKVRMQNTAGIRFVSDRDDTSGLVLRVIYDGLTGPAVQLRIGGKDTFFDLEYLRHLGSEVIVPLKDGPYSDRQLIELLRLREERRVMQIRHIKEKTRLENERAPVPFFEETPESGSEGLSAVIMARIEEIGLGVADAQTGREKHFLKVLGGEALPHGEEEKAWLAYWESLALPQDITHKRARRYLQSVSQSDTSQPGHTPLSATVRKRIDKIVSGEETASTGIEKHFLRVLEGKALPFGDEEKTWLAYWRSSQADTQRQPTIEGNRGSSELISASGPQHQEKPLSGRQDKAVPTRVQKSPKNVGESSNKAMTKSTPSANTGVESIGTSRGLKPVVPKESERTPPRPPQSRDDNGLVSSITSAMQHYVTDIESRTDLTKDQKLSRIKTYACSTCAGVAVQPIPFADIFILTPIQGYFGTRIAAIHGVPITESESTDLIKEIIGLMGMGFFAQQLAIGIWKTVSWGAGGFLTIPLVYGLSYAVMEVIDAYYQNKAKGQTMHKDAMSQVFKEAFKEGKRRGSERDEK